MLFGNLAGNPVRFRCLFNRGLRPFRPRFVVVWHDDVTEIMNSSRPAQDVEATRITIKTKITDLL